MFSFLASSHRKLSQVPIDNTDDPDIAQEIASRYSEPLLFRISHNMQVLPESASVVSNNGTKSRLG